MGPLKRALLTGLLLATPCAVAAAGVDSLEAESVPAGSVDVRALAETRSDGWRSSPGRLRFLAIVGADTVVQLSARAGPVAGAVRADPEAGNGWVSVESRSWRLVAGGVRATFGAGAILGRMGSALRAPASPPRGTLVRVTPSTSLWLPTRGAGVTCVAGNIRTALVAWEGAERVGAVLTALEQGRWRAGVMVGRVLTDEGDDVLASLALGARGAGHDALLEVGVRASAVHAVLRAVAGRHPRWTVEMGIRARGAAFGAPVASSGAGEGRRLRMAVARSGRLGPVRVRAAIWSVTDRDVSGTRAQRRYEVEVRAPLAGATVRAAARLGDDDRSEWPSALAGPAPARERLRRVRLRAALETDTGGVRQFVRLSLLMGPGDGQGVMLQWGLGWRGRRVRADARVSAAALAPGQKAWFARPDMGGRETLGVATGTGSDAALRVGVRLLGATWSGWVGTGSRRGLRAYAGVSLAR